MTRASQRLHALWLAALLGLLAFACGSEAASTPPASIEEAAGRGPYSVGVTTLELVDTSRPTEANRDYPGAEERLLMVEVWYPAAPSAAPPEETNAPLDRSDAPYPLIIFAHGLSGTRRQSVSYTQHLASHGFVVAAPDFPLSNLDAPGGPRLRAVLEQPKDVSFVIDQLLELNAQEDGQLSGGIDAQRIGMSGHSLGALTTLLTVFGPERDERVRAALPISTPGCFFPGDYASAVSVPILAVVGTNDLITPPASSRRAYAIANPPRYLVDLAGADHARFADIDVRDEDLVSADVLQTILRGDLVSDALEVAGALGGSAVACAPATSEAAKDPSLTAERQRALLRAVALPFFNAYLRGDGSARSFLEEKLPELAPELRIEIDVD